jgi:uncharacterized membrane protein (UPF0127 family)
VKRSLSFVYVLILMCITCTSCSAGGNSGNSAVYSNNSVQQPQILPEVSAKLGDNSLSIMLARSSAEKAKGLMFYESLNPVQGMLFVYSSPRIMSFWMYNTRIPLDLVFFSDQLTVTEYIESMEPGYGIPPEMLPRYVSQIPAQYALELKAGSIKRLGIKSGDQLEIPLTMLYSD